MSFGMRYYALSTLNTINTYKPYAWLRNTSDLHKGILFYGLKGGTYFSAYVLNTNVALVHIDGLKHNYISMVP